jgi:hypothetical protein
LILRAAVTIHSSGDRDGGGGDGNNGNSRNGEGSSKNGVNWEVEQIKGTDSEGTMLMMIEQEQK